MIKIKGDGDPIQRGPVTKALRNAVTNIQRVSVTRGRPKKADALSNTDRQRAFRARKKVRA